MRTPSILPLLGVRVMGESPPWASAAPFGGSLVSGIARSFAPFSDVFELLLRLLSWNHGTKAAPGTVPRQDGGNQEEHNISQQ